MSATTILDALHTYLETCPIFDGAGLFVDFLPDTGAHFAVDTAPAQPVVKRYVDGRSIRQYRFDLRLQDAYDGEVLQAIANSGLFERLVDWMDAQTRARNLPALPPGKTAQTISALTTGYLYQPHAELGRWMIQCRLTYLQEI